MRPNDITVILFFAHIIGILTLIHISFAHALQKQFILFANGAGFFQHKVGGEEHHGADFSAFVRANGYATHAGDALVAVHFSIVGGIDIAPTGHLRAQAPHLLHFRVGLGTKPTLPAFR